MWIRSNDWKFTQDAIPMLTDSPQCLCFGIFVIWWDKNLLSKRVSNILSILVFILMMMLKVNVHVQSFGQNFKISSVWVCCVFCLFLNLASSIFFQVCGDHAQSRAHISLGHNGCQHEPKGELWLLGWGNCGNCGNVWHGKINLEFCTFFKYWKETWSE